MTTEKESRLRRATHPREKPFCIHSVILHPSKKVLLVLSVFTLTDDLSSAHPHFALVSVFRSFMDLTDLSNATSLLLGAFCF